MTRLLFKIDRQLVGMDWGEYAFLLAFFLAVAFARPELLVIGGMYTMPEATWERL